MIARLIVRSTAELVRKRLSQFPAVVLVGPRQVGKTTLARRLASEQPAVYLDLERPSDRSKLADAELFFERQTPGLTVLDEVQQVPDLFRVLRGVIDERRAAGKSSGQFLLLGSASMDLLRQSGESLAGRIAYVEMRPLDVLELEPTEQRELWVRGGFPGSVLAADDEQSFAWRENFIRTYLERDIPLLGPRVPSETLRRFWTMLAHTHGGLLNMADLARGLAVDGKVVSRYVDLLVDLLLVRRLEPFHANISKRLVKSPKIYVRDTGILHALLGLGSRDDVLGHPVVGRSWEGFVIENLIAAAPEQARASFYRTAAGSEIDLLLEMPRDELWAIEIKHGLEPKLERGFHHARADLKPTRAFVVYSGTERYPKSQEVEAISVREMAQVLRAASDPSGQRKAD